MYQVRRCGPPPEAVKISAQNLEGLVGDIKGLLEPYLPLFHRVDVAETAGEYVQGLLSRLPRKSAEPMAELFNEDRKVFQRFVGESPWSDQAIRTRLREDVGQTIGDPNAVICLDPSSFSKKGTKSVGVCRQWNGRQGKVDNCQTGVYASYASKWGRTLLDGQLFLPKEWVNDVERRKQARIPSDRQYQRRWELADALLMNVAGLPHACILADSEMGRCGAWRDRLDQRGEKYILDIPANLKVQITGRGAKTTAPVKALDWARSQARWDWVRVKTREGSQGPKIYAVSCTPVVTLREDESLRKELLLAIRPLDNPDDLKLMLSNFPADTAIEVLAQFATRRWTIEDCFQRAKGECGMGHYEVRSWVGWHHHMTMAILATWLLEKLRLAKRRSFPPSHVPIVRAHPRRMHHQPSGGSRRVSEEGFQAAK